MKRNKRGFAQVNALVGGVIAFALLVVFGFLFLTNLTSTTLLPDNSLGSNASERLIANYTAGVDLVSANIPTIFSIGAFVLIVIVLIVAYVVARKNGLLGGGQIG